MAETAEQITIRKSPLDETHKRLGARMFEEGEWRVPACYGDTAAEYRAVREDDGAGLLDFSSRGRIEVSGSEAVQFLNGLITNDVKALEENAWMRAAFPNVQGRLLAEARVLRLAGDKFLFDTEAVTRERVLQTLERFTLAGDFHVRDLTEETVLLSVQGAHSTEVIKAVLNEECASLKRGRIGAREWGGETIRVIRATHTAEDGFDLFISAQGAVSLWDALYSSGARAVGFDALDILRIEAGVARYGVDMDETNVVLEAAPEEALSFTKGCYVGQEIIARIHWRGHVAKKLTGLIFDDQGETARGDKIRTADGKEIGRLTSVTLSPALNRLVALGYVKYDYLAPGTEVRVLSNERELAARVATPPFVKGSWAGTNGAEEEKEGA